MSSNSRPLAVQVPLEDLKRPTFGYSVQLGELFNERTSRFLGVQLYRQNLNRTVVTNAQKTDIAFSSSFSFETDTQLLDIGTSLSLEILGGLVDVGGSATYLKDTTSNSKTRSWVLALKVRSEERRLLHAEEELSSNVLDAVKSDYLPHATHFVSSITYGGNLIIGMTAKSTEVTDKDMREKNLGLQITALCEQAVSCATQAGVKDKTQFECMNSKFDIIVQGDIKVDVNISNPADVLDIIPRAASLICAPVDGGPRGVPVSVVLRPIPKTILGDCVPLPVYRISQPVTHLAFGIFTQLEDIRKCCHVLTARMASHRDFIPKLDNNAIGLSSAFKFHYDGLKEQLARFLSDLMTSGQSDITLSSFTSSSPETMAWLTNPVPEEGRSYAQILVSRMKAMTAHSGPSFNNELVPLEEAFSDFEQFLVAIQGIPFLRLSTIDEVARVARCQSPFHLLLVPLDKSRAKMAMATYYALLRNIKAGRPQVPYILYVEDPSDLVESLPNGGVFSQLDVPSYYIGTADERCMVSWKLADPQTFRRRKLLSWFPSSAYEFPLT
ncbi:hypothetical protein EDC04DRAFT_2951786 [Pisolithus marmoratus]|nr:hypothetical protein EDC04DRAFT_2951786 [Pisolithus marmoratus]